MKPVPTHLKVQDNSSPIRKVHRHGPAARGRKGQDRISRAAVRAALQEAASVAGLLITTDTMVGELPKKEARMPCRGRRDRGMESELT